jgi:excisionase family DNA binding protein
MSDPILIAINDAAASIGISRRTIYELIAADKITAVKSGGRTLVVYETLKRYAANLPVAKFKPDMRRQHQVAV